MRKLSGKFHFCLRFCTRKRNETYTFSKLISTYLSVMSPSSLHYVRSKISFSDWSSYVIIQSRTTYRPQFGDTPRKKPKRSIDHNRIILRVVLLLVIEWRICLLGDLLFNWMTYLFITWHFFNWMTYLFIWLYLGSGSRGGLRGPWSPQPCENRS